MRDSADSTPARSADSDEADHPDGSSVPFAVHASDHDIGGSSPGRGPTVRAAVEPRPGTIPPACGRPCITVSGFCSGVGKTSVVERLLHLLGFSAAVKVTVVDAGVEACPIGRACGICRGLRRPFDIVTDRRRIEVPRKDTGRYHAAGARPVVWIQAHADHVEQALAAALRAIGRRPVVVEGNTPVPFLDPDLAIMVDRAGPRRRTKPSADLVLGRVGLVILNHAADNSVEEIAEARRRIGAEVPGAPVVEIDVRGAAAAGLQRAFAPHLWPLGIRVADRLADRLAVGSVEQPC